MRHKKSIALPGPAPTPLPTPRMAPSTGTPGPRFLVLHLPLFALERCGWSASDLVALLVEDHQVPRVAALTPAAAARGPAVGMTAAEARALLPELKVELSTQPGETAADLAALTHTLERLLPEPRPLGESAIASRTDRLRRPEEELLRRSITLLRELGHEAQGVVADECQGALALAARAPERRAPPGLIVPPGGLAAALNPLPVEALAPSPRLLDMLLLLGVRSAGQLAALDAASVANRFGAEGLRLHQIVRGQHPHAPPAPPPDPGRPVLRRALPEPSDRLETVLLALEGLCQRLSATLGALDQAALRLGVQLELEDHPPVQLSVRLGQPRRAEKELLTLIRQRLENVQLPGLVAAVQLELLESCPFTGQQQGLLDRHAGVESLPELLARLSDALGAQALFSPVLRPDHRPERRWSAGPIPLKNPGNTPVPGTHRPTLLLREPRAVEVRQSAQGAILALGLDSEPLPTRRVWGPERLEGAWWEPEPMDRDYHRVELVDGRQAWIFFDRPSESWWLHGMWD